MNGKRRWSVGRTRPLEAGLHRTAAPFVGRGMGRQKGSKWSWSRKVRVDQRIPANARFHKGPRMPAASSGEQPWCNRRRCICCVLDPQTLGSVCNRAKW